MVRQAFVYRLLPTPAQETILVQTLALCRDLYNSFLHWRKYDFETLGKSPTCNQQQKALPHWKKTHPELCSVFSQTLQEVAKRVDFAFQAFFRRVQKGETSGYPRFKGVGQYDSFTYPQSGFSLGDEGLDLSKIGILKIILHRPVQGKIKTLTIRRRRDKWYACFSCEVSEQPLPPSPEQIGIDVGLSHFATLSDGTTVENPRFFRQDETALKKAQRKLSQEKRGTSDQRKARKVVSRIHERIRNRRHNFVHQFARQVVNRFGTISIEKLHVGNMSCRPKPKVDEETGGYLPNGASAKSGLNKSILDAAWSQFRNALAQKAESAVRCLVMVNPAYTSQDCSQCGFRVRKTLQERVHSCPNCGLVLDRDHNAALNILQIAVGLHSDGTQSEEAADTHKWVPVRAE